MEKKQITKETTWRQFLDNPFLHSSDLPKGGMNVTISKFGFKEAYSKESKAKEDLQVMYLKEFKKPVVMSNRKSKEISALFGDKVLDSVGKRLHIFSINEHFFGKWQDVIHFKAEVIKKKVVFNEKSAGWEKACEAFKQGKSSIEAIEKHYVLDEKTKETLTNLLPKK